MTVTVPGGTDTWHLIPPFIWPAVDQTATGVYFYAAFLNPDMTAVEGDMDWVEWGYGPR